MIASDNSRRVLSGMRPTGSLHLGHYHGALKNWIDLQNEYECWFFVADWHALTTAYDKPQDIAESAFNLVVDWMAVGINPNVAHLFIQSQVPEHAELQLLLGMATPLSWLERVPSYKDQQKKMQDKDLATFGFLGYPLLQSADILLYRAGLVPVGADQVPHVEMAREVARRFNYLYGRTPGFEEMAEAAIGQLGKKAGRLYRKLSKAYQEQGDHEALAQGRALLDEHPSLSIGNKERLFGYLQGAGRIILREPKALLTDTSKVPGLDGEKMSKSAKNTITLRDKPDEIADKIRTMKTDPKRLRLTDPGDPSKCPVFELHQIYSNEETQSWAKAGCQSAGIGCVDCKKPVTDAIQSQIAPIRSEAERLAGNRDFIMKVLEEGAEKAREEANATLEEVRHALGLVYRP